MYLFVRLTMARKKQKKVKSTFTFGNAIYQDKKMENKAVPSLNSGKDSLSIISFEVKDSKESKDTKFKFGIAATKPQKVSRFKIKPLSEKQKSIGEGYKIRREAVNGIKSLMVDDKEKNQLVIETYTAGNRTNTETGLNVSRISGKQKQYRKGKPLVKESTREKASHNFKKALKKVTRNV